MAAVKSPIPEAVLDLSSSTTTDGPSLPKGHGMSERARTMSSNDPNGLNPPEGALNPTSPSDPTAPNSAISGSSIDTDFTDLTGVSGVTNGLRGQHAASQLHNQIRTTSIHSKIKSPTEKSPELKIQTYSTPRYSLQGIVNEPQSVIHIPTGFGSFRPSALAQRRARSPSRSQSSQRSDSKDSARSSAAGPAHTEVSVEAPSHVLSDTLSSNATVIPTIQDDDPPVVVQTSRPRPTSPQPIQTMIPASSSERGTPRAQTRSEASGFSRPGSSLASISEAEDSGSDKPVATKEPDATDNLRRASEYVQASEAEISVLETALAECWTLCNTLAGLSSIHRERMFEFSGKGDMQEQAWKACWKMCQNLYDNREDQSLVYSRPTLDLCREFCLALFEIRVRDNETADSVLRVSFELNNHLFNTHDRSLPDQFRERTLDFYITLCHRLMKQKTSRDEESDSLLRACWSLAEMLFSLRQNRRENRKPDEELLGSAVQACWELCDIFREGWTQIRPERGTPRPSQTTFTQAFNQARRTTIDQPEEYPSYAPRRFLPETPTTIFEDINSANVISPDRLAQQSFAMPPQPQRRLIEESPQTLPIDAPSFPSQDSPMSTTTFATDSSMASSAAAMPARGRAPPSLTGSNGFGRSNTYPNANMTVQRSGWNNYAPSMRTASNAPSETGISVANTATTRTTNRTTTTRTTDTITRKNFAQNQEDPVLTLLKTLFLRAALQSGQGFHPTSSDADRSNLQRFVEALPDDAFGILSWQTSLLDSYKRAIAEDPGFGQIAAAQLLQRSAGGHLEVAKAVQRMVKAVYGFGWLRDLYRFVYGVYVEEILQGAQPLNHQFLPGTAGVGSLTGMKAGLRARSSTGSLGGGPVRGASLADKLAEQAAIRAAGGRTLDPVRMGESASATVPMSKENSKEGDSMEEEEQ